MVKWLSGSPRLASPVADRPADANPIRLSKYNMIHPCICPSVFLTLEDAATDRDGRSEWALLVYIGALNGLLWCAVAETDRLVVTNDAARLLSREGVALGNTLLLLECALDLREREEGVYMCVGVR